MRTAMACFLAVVALGCVGAARAEVIVSSFGPGDSYNQSELWKVFGVNFGYQSVSQSFVPGANYTLSTIDLALIAGQDYLIELNADKGGIPGTVLETWANHPVTEPMSLTSLTGAALTAGSTYWISIFPSTVNTLGGWFYNSEGVSGPRLFQSSPAGAWNGGPPTTTGAFRVNGTLVVAPEPVSLTLASLGLLSLVATRRRRWQ